MSSHIIATDPREKKHYFITIDRDNESHIFTHGERYVAKRNTGWQYLTCDKVTDNYIICEEPAYYYDTWEAFHILSIVPLEDVSCPEIGIDNYQALIKKVEDYVLGNRLPVEVSNLMHMDIDSIRVLISIINKEREATTNGQK